MNTKTILLVLGGLAVFYALTRRADIMTALNGLPTNSTPGKNVVPGPNGLPTA